MRNFSSIFIIYRCKVHFIDNSSTYKSLYNVYQISSGLNKMLFLLENCENDRHKSKSGPNKHYWISTDCKRPNRNIKHFNISKHA